MGAFAQNAKRNNLLWARYDTSLKTPDMAQLVAPGAAPESISSLAAPSGLSKIGAIVSNPYVRLGLTAAKAGSTIYAGIQEGKKLRKLEQKSEERIRRGDPLVAAAQGTALRRSAARKQQTLRLTTGMPTSEAISERSRIERGFGQQETDIQAQAGAAQSAFRAQEREGLADIQAAQASLKGRVVREVAEDVVSGVSETAGQALRLQRIMSEDQQAREAGKRQEEQLRLQRFGVEQAGEQFQQEMRLKGEQLTADKQALQDRQKFEQKMLGMKQKFEQTESEKERGVKTSESEADRLSREKIASEARQSQERIATENRKARVAAESERIRSKAGEKASTVFGAEIRTLDKSFYTEGSFGKRLTTDVFKDEEKAAAAIDAAAKRIFKSAPGAYESEDEVAEALLRHYGII